MSRLSFDAPPYNNSLAIADLIYKFRPFENLSVFIDAVGGEVSGELLTSTQPFSTLAPYTVSISRFGRFDPIYYQTLARPGIAANYKFSDQLSFGAGFYGDFDSGNPQTGFFNGGNAAIAQLAYFPTDTLGMTLVYVRSYNPAGPGVAVSGQTGSLYADQPFGTNFTPPGTFGNSVPAPASIATSADHATFGFGWRALPELAFTGDIGFAFAHAEQANPSFNVNRGDSATIFEWNFGLSLIDLFGQGLEVAMRQIVDITSGKNTFQPGPQQFSNLRAYKREENGKIIIECHAEHYMEPISNFLFLTQNMENEIFVTCSSENSFTGLESTRP
jgi:hypothetical protein